MLALQQQQYAANAAYNSYADNFYYCDSEDKQEDASTGENAENEFGISEASIMQKAENEAKQHVITRMEKKMEARLEKEMMSKMNSGGGPPGMSGSTHKKRKRVQNNADDADQASEEHGGMPMDEEQEE